MLGRLKLIVLVGMLVAAPCFGQTAGMLSFQGLIKDDQGDPVKGPVDLFFYVFNAELGGSVVAGPFGQSNVTVTNGFISTKFGPVAPSVFDGCDTSTPCRWLEVRVDDGGGGGFVPLSRVELVTAPATSEQVNYKGTSNPAIVAENDVISIYAGTGNPAIVVENDLITIGNGVLSAFIPTASVGIATTSPGYPGHDSVVLELFGAPRPIFLIHRPANASQPEAEFLIGMEDQDSKLRIVQGDGVSLPRDLESGIIIDSTGFVGIGTESPSTRLDVAGALNVQGSMTANGNIRKKDGIGVEIDLIAEAAGGGGFIATNGPLGPRNVVLSSLEGFNSNGFVAVKDEFSITRAGMYVQSDGQGVVFADIKSFRMKHPTRPETDIWYACPEGPEAAAYFRGTGQLVGGRATVTSPDHFALVANSDGMTVHLTPRSSKSTGLAVVERSAQGFVVEELGGGQGTYDFDYYVMAVRKGHEKYRVIRPANEVRAAPAANVGSMKAQIAKNAE